LGTPRTGLSRDVRGLRSQVAVEVPDVPVPVGQVFPLAVRWSLFLPHRETWTAWGMPRCFREEEESSAMNRKISLDSPCAMLYIHY
jgi:hypothetical protein